MGQTVCIRKEYKGKWEGRTPLTPEAVKELTSHGVPITVEPSSVRIFKDHEYREAGAAEVADCSDAKVVLGIKEPPLEIIGKGQVHIAFSHTIKGQESNMPLLQRFLDQRATLIDYETITNPDTGVRLIAFGRYAGIAGAVDTLYVAGLKKKAAGAASWLTRIGPTHQYPTIQNLKIELGGLSPEKGEKLRVIIVGSGNAGRGAEEVCTWLGLPRIEPETLRDNPPEGNWYCVLDTVDVVHRDDQAPYDRRDYYRHGAERYNSTFHQYLGKFDILLYTPYWDDKYPRHLTREQILKHQDKMPWVIGDITCDINGSLECTLKASTIEEPAFSYDPESKEITDGIHLDGVTVMSIDHLPCELSRDASEHFSRNLRDFIPSIAAMDLGKDLDQCGLPLELRNAVIVYNGKLTPAFEHLETYLS